MGVQIYKRCLPCGVKVHVCASVCWKCGKRVEEMTYGSEGPGAAIYNKMLNNIEKCLFCPDARNGNICTYAVCFGSGRGDCAICRNTESGRFNCCRELQAKERELGEESRRLERRLCFS